MVQTRTAPRSKTSSSRFRHNDYKPFLKYIERQSINNINKIDHAEKSQKIKNKLSSISSNLDNNNNSNNNNNNNNINSNSNNNKNSITKNIIMSSVNSSSSSNGFNIQKSNAAYKAKKKNDDRHKDLHANTKTKDFTDSDKIFLLKREIDNLRGQQIIDSSSYRSVEQQKFASNSSGVTTTNNNNNNAMAYKVPLLTVMLAFGVLLVASKYLKRKLNQIRSSDSLLMANYNSQDDETNMVELRSSYTHTSGSSSSSSSLSTEQPQIFVIDSNNDEEQSSSVPAAAAAAYKAPSETSGAGAGAAGADMQFV
jgi:hypothetical protein